jgi:hypothetical protein
MEFGEQIYIEAMRRRGMTPDGKKIPPDKTVKGKVA